MVKDGLAGVPLVVETAQVFETHHVAMLLAAGASAVVPYLAEEFAESEEAGAFEKVRKGMSAGLRKVLARMGISTLASYRNSHLFEVLGLDEDICRAYFEDAGCYPGTKTLDLLLEDYLKMHAAAYKEQAKSLPTSACTASARRGVTREFTRAGAALACAREAAGRRAFRGRRTACRK